MFHTINTTNGWFRHVWWQYTFIFPTNCRLFKDNVLLSKNGLPNNYTKAKKMMKRLGVEYISYHTCLNDYIMYIDAYVDKERCLKCGCERYQESKYKCKAHGPPHKILRNMPIIPRNSKALSLEIINCVVEVACLT